MEDELSCAESQLVPVSECRGIFCQSIVQHCAVCGIEIHNLVMPPLTSDERMMARNGRVHEHQIVIEGSADGETLVRTTQ